MRSEINFAVAGSGKTHQILERIKALPSGTKAATLTFTINCQTEITRRLPTYLPAQHVTMGWYKFLVTHIIRPYLPDLYPGIRPRGLHFVQSQDKIPKGRKGWEHYFDDDHRPYSARLGLLAKIVLEKTNYASIQRLERIFDYIFIDEVQDLAGNDREVVKALLKSTITIYCCGDPRQTVLSTARGDRLNRQYQGTGLYTWANKLRDEGLCSVTHSNFSHRFNESIARFSDLIHDPNAGFKTTEARSTNHKEHQGVFLLNRSDVLLYAAALGSKLTVLRYRKSTTQYPGIEVLNFRVSKGITRDNVAIISTQPIEDLLSDNKFLKPESAASFYVAATRARHSVGIAVKDAKKIYSNLHPAFKGIVSLWAPDQTS